MRYELSRNVVDAYRAWDSLEVRLAEEAKAAGQAEDRFIEIVDIDVLPRYENPVSFTSRTEVRWALEDFLENPALKYAPSEEYIRRRLGSSLLHLRKLEGESINIFDHIETAMSVEPVPVDEEELDDRQQALDDKFKKHGLGFDKAYEDAFMSLALRESDEGMRQRLIAIARQTGALAVGEDPEDSLVIPEVVSVDAGWAGYFSTDKDGKPFVQFNNHRRHAHTAARAAAIMLHEGKGHAEDFAAKRDAIIRGRMDPIFGQTTIHGPENTTAETIALGREWQGLRRMRGEDAWQYHLQADYHDYQETVWWSAQVRICSGEPEDEVVEYLQGRMLPHEKEENMRKRAQEMRDDPAIGANDGCYEPASGIVRLVLAKPPEQQERLFREFGRYPYSEAQMRAIVAG